MNPTRLRRLSVLVLMLAPAWAGFAPGPAAKPADAAATRFSWVDVYVDSGDAPLAAWQIDLRALDGVTRIVGIEGGAHPAFADPPLHDPEAIRHERVILAAYSTGRALPRGRVRVASIHLEIPESGHGAYALELLAAATLEGRRIDVVSECVPGS